MNYFELYGIRESFSPNLVVVKKQFYALSRQYHPDFFGGASEANQEESLQKTAAINTAYQVFQSKEATIQYMLQLHGLLESEEKYALPPAFLMEVMELNEQVMELDKQDAAAKASIQLLLTELQNSIYEPIEEIIGADRENIGTEKELLQVKEYYYKKKYLDRIAAELG